MNIWTVCTPFSNYEDVVRDLESKFANLEFEPRILLVFFTDSVWRDHEKILEYLKGRFSNSKMAGCFVEGYATPEVVWMRGLAILLIDAEGVEIFWAKGKNTAETFVKLRSKIDLGWDSVLLIFPAFYFPGKFDIFKIYFSNIYYYNLLYKRARIFDDKMRILKDYSKMLESRCIFPVNKVLRLMPEDTPVVGMNLMPLEAKFGTPRIFVNYENIGRGAVAVCFKGKVNTIFHDVFPERGKCFEETVEILKNYFPNVEIVNVVKKDIAIGEINGMKPVDFLEMKVKAYKPLNKDATIKRLEKGQFQTVSPYALAFISKETFGSSMLGLLPYPINIYPSLFELDYFYSTCVFFGEQFKDGIKRFKDLFEKKKYTTSFDLFIIDHNTIPMFGKLIHRIISFAKEKCSNFLGLFLSNPSAKLDKLDKRYLTEIEQHLCFSGTGTSAMIELEFL